MSLSDKEDPNFVTKVLLRRKTSPAPSQFRQVARLVRPDGPSPDSLDILLFSPGW